jgi:excisionase family DNA binding protein
MQSNSTPTAELLTPDELARMLRISKAGVYRLVEGRHIRFYKVGGSLRFEKNDVLAYLRENRVEQQQK